jgi:hypothetical protein
MCIPVKALFPENYRFKKLASQFWRYTGLIFLSAMIGQR